jgi:hypothetical protein
LLGEPDHFLIASEFNPVRIWPLTKYNHQDIDGAANSKKRFAHPSRDSGIALAVAGTPAEAGEDDDEGDDVEDGSDDGEDQLHLQEGERQPHLNRFIHYLQRQHTRFF